MVRVWIFMFLVAVAAMLVAVRLVYTETGRFPDRSGTPVMASTAMELVAELPHPPGNIAVRNDREFFFTFHPLGDASVSVAHWSAGSYQPFPSPDWQPGGAQEGAFREVLSLRISGQNLWLLDNGRHGLSSVRLLAFDMTSGQLVHSYRFPRDVFPLGSFANDFRISRDGRYFFITDASLLARTPALVVYDRQNGKSRRLLQDHPSVLPGPFEPVVQGQEMTLFGLLTVNPGVDGIALDARDEWLYYAAVSADQLYRVRTADLLNADLPAASLAHRVEALGEKTMTDGMAVDRHGNVYLSDIEHSAIVRRGPEGELQTLLRSVDIRWPDGFSLYQDQLYFTCSALHQVMGLTDTSDRDHAPFQIYRVRLNNAEAAL